MTCAYLMPEMKAAVAAEGFSGLELRSFPARCGRPVICAEELLLDTVKAERVELFGSFCLQGLDNPVTGNDHCAVNRCEQCFYQLCSPTLVNGLQQEGAYLLTPGWLANWQHHIREWGFDRDTAVAFFRESCQHLFLLDTGVDGNADRNLAAFSTFLQLPGKSLPIGLDYHRLLLAKTVTRHQHRRQLCEQKEEKEQAVRQSADLAMALDLLGRITSDNSETGVRDRIIDLFTMLLAPQRVRYWRVQQSELQLDEISLSDNELEELNRFHSNTGKQYLLNSREDGFFLRLGRGSRATAILCIERVSLPRYIHYYLNVAINVADVCAQAIEHARTVAVLVDTSRLAGKAEVATEVLHNVGNTLNSVSVCCESVFEMVSRSSSASMDGVVRILNEHRPDLASFFGDDPRAVKIVDYLSRLAEQLSEERAKLLAEINRQRGNIALIGEIIRTQQDLTTNVSFLEALDPAGLLEECLQLFARQLESSRIEVERDYGSFPVIRGDRHKILQVVTNLVSNAVEALDEIGLSNPAMDKKIRLRLFQSNHQLVLEVEDNGKGIQSKDLPEIFVFGFSTRKEGHGFGLHNSANLVKGMGGTLTGESRGKGKGAIFRLRLPISDE